MKICSNCGNKFDDDEIYCNNCGYKLKTVESPQKQEESSNNDNSEDVPFLVSAIPMIIAIILCYLVIKIQI